jgi:hypothetical protein
MSPPQRQVKKQAKARQRRRLTAQERLARDRRQAQHAAKVLEQALHTLGLPENLVAEIEGRLRSQQHLLGKICGVMCPPLFGCRTNTELCRVRGWDKNLPSRVLGALPKRSWIKRLRRLGVDVLVPLWHYAASKSEATRSRWQWTWVGDDSVCKKYGEQSGLVGTWWRGQEHRVLSGIDGVRESRMNTSPTHGSERSVPFSHAMTGTLVRSRYRPHWRADVCASGHHLHIFRIMAKLEPHSFLVPLSLPH